MSRTKIIRHVPLRLFRNCIKEGKLVYEHTCRKCPFREPVVGTLINCTYDGSKDTENSLKLGSKEVTEE